jgi:peptide chain release factor 3
VGVSGDFRGVLDRRTGGYIRYERTAGGATRAPEQHLDADAAQTAEGEWWTTARDEHELLAADGADHDQDTFLAGRTTPVLFASAISNFGVAQLLQTLVELAPPPRPTPTAEGDRRDVAEPFSAFVFKVQAGMDAAHRDRLAYARVVSGVFRRGMVATHAESGRPFATKYAQAVFGRERLVVDTAYPGDIVGLVNASALRVGDSIFEDVPVRFPPIASFAPEHFRTVRAKDSGRYKQFRRGIEQLDQEGVVQVLRSDLRGSQAPVLAAVGPMQFEVVEARMRDEFKAPVRLDQLDYSIARRTRREDVVELNSQRGVEVLERSDGELLALFPDKWRIRSVLRAQPDLVLEPLVAGEED